MVKHLAALFFLLCFLLSGCFFAPIELDYAPPASYADPNYEEMEIYQYLSQAITGNSSLDEMLEMAKDYLNGRELTDLERQKFHIEE